MAFRRCFSGTTSGLSVTHVLHRKSTLLLNTTAAWKRKGKKNPNRIKSAYMRVSVIFFILKVFVIQVKQAYRSSHVWSWEYKALSENIQYLMCLYRIVMHYIINKWRWQRWRVGLQWANILFGKYVYHLIHVLLKKEKEKKNKKKCENYTREKSSNPPWMTAMSIFIYQLFIFIYSMFASVASKTSFEMKF